MKHDPNLIQADEPDHVTRPSSNVIMDVLALGAGIALLLSARKSRSPIGKLLKGSAATALLGKAAKNTGHLGKAADFLSGSRRKTSIRK